MLQEVVPTATPTWVAERHDGAADLERDVIGPGDRGHAGRIGPDHGKVAVSVETDDSVIGLASVREKDADVVAVEVVGVGEDLAVLDHDAGAAAPSVSDPDGGRSDGCRDPSDRAAELIQCCHLCCPSL